MRQDADQIVTLADYVQILRRGKWGFATTALVAPLIALLLTLGHPTSYAASAKVLLNQQSITDSLFGAQTQYVDPARAAQTQADLARVLEVTEHVVHTSVVPKLTSATLLQMSSVTASPGSDFLTFTVTAASASEATDLANDYARSFVGYRQTLDGRAIAHARTVTLRRAQHLRAAGLGGTAAYRTVQQQLAALDGVSVPTLVVLHDGDHAIKIAPPIVRNTGLGLALGIVFGLILVFFRDIFDTRVTSLDRIRVALRALPDLGRLPAPPQILRKRGELVMMAAPTSDEADAFRVLRANFDLQVGKTGARTVMITSGVAGEGKSTTAGNLAVALARAGRSVILVDFDLRSPHLHYLFDVAGEPGLIDVALGELDVDDVLAEIPLPDGAHPDETGRLSVLPVGGSLANPDELRVEFVVERVLKHLQKRADCVLIDAGPLLPDGDAIALSSFVDAILLVVRLNGIASEALDDLTRILTSFATIKLGYVVTGAETLPHSTSYSGSAGSATRRSAVVENEVEAKSA